LKLTCSSKKILPINIREQDPLKQGLKQLKLGVSEEDKEIREQDPLKQGLKPERL